MVEEQRRVERDERIRKRVGQIAAVLDVPMEYFYTDTSVQGGFAEAHELLRLWFRILTPEGRRRALELLRVLSEGGEA